MMKHLIPLVSVLALATIACKKKPDPIPDVVEYGKNRFTTVIDGFEREYYVHVPQGYKHNSTIVPVVFMLHGTSGDGEEFYDRSGWREVGESENLITVFPSSARHCIIDGDGITKTTTKWNSQPSEWQYCAGEVPRDDIKFLSTIIDELTARYSIDVKRVYLAGFSNGGQMAAKCSILLSHRLAAIVESAGTFSLDTTFTPMRKMPTVFQIGNEDYGAGNTGPAVSLDKLDEAIATPGYSIHRSASTHGKSFMLSSNYQLRGDTNSVRIATFYALNGDTTIQHNIAFIKGLAHAYPNGDNHPMEAAVVNWKWMKQFRLP